MSSGFVSSGSFVSSGFVFSEAAVAIARTENMLYCGPVVFSFNIIPSHSFIF